MSGWRPWAEKPGQMYRMVSLPGCSWEHSRMLVMLPCMDPTVGTIPFGSMSMSMNALTKREALRLSSGKPWTEG